MAAELGAVPFDQVRAFFPRVREMLDAGFAASDEIMPADLVDRIEQKCMVLWVAVDEVGPLAVMLTELVMMRSGLCCRMMHCGGASMEKWHHLCGRIEQYARDEGCVKTLMGDTRKGWRRVLPGYEEIGVTLGKVLT